MKNTQVFHARTSGGGAARAVAGAAVAALALAPAGSALADCVAPTPHVVWSSPAAGAVDVPVDADLLLVTEAIDLDSAELSVFVGGLRELPLEAGSPLPGHYALPELEPNQAHTIVVRPYDGTPITIGFTTGARRASGGEGSLDLTAVRQERYATGLVQPALCTEVLFRNSCFDTGIPLLRSFEVDSGVAPLGEQSLWAIETLRLDIEASANLESAPQPYFTSWPAACGSPRQWGFGSEAEYRLHNIGENGAIRESNTLARAFDELPPPWSDYDRPGHIMCSTSLGRARPPGALVAASALALAALWRRRRSRAR